MTVEYKDVTARWLRIRKNPKCDLALSPSKVAAFLATRESENVTQKIRDSLTHLAEWRLETTDFENDETGSGPIVTCEGLEAFLVPAVEGALTLSDFLAGYKRRDELAEALVRDIEGLLKRWDKDGFTGEPYTNQAEIRKSVDPKKKKGLGKINITEATAVATRVIVHLLTLQLQRPNEKLFHELIGSKLDIEALFSCLAEAIRSLVEAFQKSDDKENPIGNASIQQEEGSGWSWTAYPGLSPMLFFTAAAVDAFAELDLYLIRPATLFTEDECDDALRSFYGTHKEELLNYQFCVDMARRWVVNEVLPNISTGLGFYGEMRDEASGKDLIEIPDGFGEYSDELKRVAKSEDDENLADEPGRIFLLYNNLYALLILLWTFADWDDEGAEQEAEVVAATERALLQLVYGYRIPVWKEVLDGFQLKFNLFGGSLFQRGRCVPYMDSGFGTQFARLLIFYGVYGVGDRTVLDPLTQDLYVGLLMDRNRNDANSAYLWSSRVREVFSTQRAIQVLTFYQAFARGREYANYGGGDRNSMADFFRGVANLLDEEPSRPRADEKAEDETLGDVEEPREQEPEIEAESMKDYCDFVSKPFVLMHSEFLDEIGDIIEFGTKILNWYHEKKVPFADAKPFLDDCAEFLHMPHDDKNELKEEARQELRDRYQELQSRHDLNESEI